MNNVFCGYLKVSILFEILQNIDDYVKEILVGGVTRYACKLCGVHYKLKRQCYHYHVKGKHLGEMYKCPYCPYTSSLKGNILAHMKKRGHRHQ